MEEWSVLCAPLSKHYGTAVSVCVSVLCMPLVCNVAAMLQNGSEFRNDVYNDTISIVELEEGFDGETFFMYVFMISGLCLLMFVVHYVYTTMYRKVGVGTGVVGMWEGWQYFSLFWTKLLKEGETLGLFH